MIYIYIFKKRIYIYISFVYIYIHRVIGAYIIVVEIFMPSRLQALMGFYVTWIGKAVLFIFVGVLFIIPFDEFNGGNNDICIYFIITAVYNFILAVFLIVLGILSLVHVVSRRSSSSIIVTTGSSSSSSSKKTTTTTTTVTVEKN